ncbi:MAG: hypothetical protein LBO62_00285 [Endomicrobium sp.]|jgi:Flp pilus assembly pilin Flp|nr:hypothetical protein [Endomicrobium sp.]
MFDFSWMRRHKGQGMVEYILIVAVVVGVIFGAYKIMGGKVKEKFESATKTIETADKSTTKN